VAHGIPVACRNHCTPPLFLKGVCTAPSGVRSAPPEESGDHRARDATGGAAARALKDPVIERDHCMGELTLARAPAETLLR
jgi:hypothetical protein